MKRLTSRLLVILTVLLAQVSTAFAATSVSVSTLDIKAGQQKDVTVSISADKADIYQIQATISLPQGLSLVASGTSYAQPAEITQGFIVDINTAGTLLVSNFNMQPISKNEGAIATFRVEADETLAEVAAINVTGIKVWRTDFTSETLAPATGVVTKQDATMDTADFLFGSSQLTLSAGTSNTVTVNMNNEVAVTGFEATLTLPAGVTATVSKASRLASDPTYNATTGKIVYFSGAAISGNQGALFNITLTADDTFKQDALVKLNDIILSTPGSKEIFVPAIQLQLIAKDEAAKAAADKILTDLQEKLDNTVATIDKNYPDAADDKEIVADEKAIQGEINALDTEIEDAYAANTLDPTKVQETAGGISKEIDDLLVKAKDLQKAIDDEKAAQQANEDGKAALDDEIAELQQKLDDAVASEPNDLPNAIKKEFGDDADAIQNDIDALKAQAERDYADGKLTADSKLDPAKKKAILDAIDALKAKIAKWLRGDVENDQDVDMDDFYALGDSILDENLPTDKESNAFYRFDANADEEINVGDMQGILNICLGLNADGSVGARESENISAELSVEKEATANGMRYTLTIKGMNFTGYQMDIQGARVLSENSTLNVRKAEKNGSTRLLAIGMEQEEGQVLTVETSGSARFQNVVFTTANAQTVKFDLSTTGISGIATDKAQQQVYNLSGRAVKSAKGLVITEGKKMIRK